VEKAGGAEKGVQVFEAFEVRSNFEEELVGKRQKRGIAFAFCGPRTHRGYVVSDIMSAELMCGMDAGELHLPGILCDCRWLLAAVDDVMTRDPDPLD
jgi:hypothetical protein